jgi:hypothetical protein
MTRLRMEIPPETLPRKITEKPLSMSEKHGNDSLHAQGWIGDKPCLMTTDSGMSVTVAWPNITAGLPQRPTHAICPADGIIGDHPHLEESFRKTDFEAVPTDYLCVRRQYH